MTTKIKSGVIGDNVVGITQLNVSDGTNGQVLTTDGSGTLSFADGGVDGIVSSADATAITIDSSEKVGLNKVPSTWHLDVNSSDIYVASFEGSNNNGVIINSDTGSGDIIGYSNSTSTYNPLNIRGATGVGLYIDTSNNVGIGTSSPDAVLTTVNSGALTLDSNDGDHSGFGLLIEPSTLTANTVNSAIGFANSNGRKYAAIGMQTYADGDQNGLNFYVQTTASGSGATLTEAMRITNDGTVGIGVSPSSEFHVKGDANTVARIEPNNNSGKATLLVSSSGSGDGGMQYDANLNKMHIFSYSDMSFNVGTGNLSGNYPANERMRITSDGVGMGDTDGDYNHRGATGGLHVKRGGILMNGPPGDANMSSATNGNQWTYLGQGGRGGSFTSLTISVPNPNGGASGVGYGGFSLEFYIAGYNAKYHSGHFSGYTNGGITLSKRAFWDSSGSGTLSSGSVGAQGFYLTIGFPSMTHPTCKFVINKGGHGGSAGNAAWTDMDGVSVTWA